MAKSIVQEFTKGLWNEIPPFRLVLGLCPVLGVTTSMKNGIGMGLATTFVLLCSNVLVSLLRKVIPSKVRIACFIIIIATFVIVVELVSQAFAPDIYDSLGVFIPLIVVNCIVLGRAEAFASKNGIVPSVADGLGIGIGFTCSLAALGAVRELLGTGGLKGRYLRSTALRGGQYLRGCLCPLQVRHRSTWRVHLSRPDALLDEPRSEQVIFRRSPWNILKSSSAASSSTTFCLAKFLGNCPFLGTSKKMETALGMAMAVIFVLVMAGVITWAIFNWLLIPFKLEFLRTIAFISGDRFTGSVCRDVLEKKHPRALCRAGHFFFR